MLLLRCAPLRLVVQCWSRCGAVQVVRRNYVSKMNIRTHHMQKLSKESAKEASTSVSVTHCDFTEGGKWMVTVRLPRC